MAHQLLTSPRKPRMVTTTCCILASPENGGHAYEQFMTDLAPVKNKAEAPAPI
jgi:hypothetical protein